MPVIHLLESVDSRPGNLQDLFLAEAHVRKNLKALDLKDPVRELGSAG